MRNSLKHLTPEQKKEYYKQQAKRRYAEKVGRPVRKTITGLTDEEKKEKRRREYLKYTEGKGVKRQPNYSKMTDEEKKEYKRLKQVEYNRKSREKRLKENPLQRKSLNHLTEEEKKERRRKRNRDAYRKKQESLGITIRPYIKLTPEQKEQKIIDLEKKKLEKEKFKKENYFYLKEQRRIKRNKKDRERRKEKGYTPKSKNYIINNELTYEIILSKGKGSPTEKLKIMLYDMCLNINKKFYYYNDDMRYDIMMNSYINVMGSYYSFDEIKFKNSFAYITEIIKRSHTNNFHKEKNKGVKVNPSIYSYDLQVGFVSTSEFDNF